ncbi:MAG: hypothetical protein AABY09_04590 [Nanoarchaeota archaeon]
MKGLLLLSGGFDSPVAGILMRRKNVEISAIHFSGKPFINEATEQKAKVLAKLIRCDRIAIFPFGKIQAEVVKKCRHKLYYIITKRMMFRIAEAFAKENGYDFLVTGDNLGQVGSQTLKNMALINSAVNINILQPLLTFDKQEIINLAKELGTYDASVGPEMCCALGPKHPSTAAKSDLVVSEEARLDTDNLIKEAFQNIETEEIR